MHARTIPHTRHRHDKHTAHTLNNELEYREELSVMDLHVESLQGPSHATPHLEYTEVSTGYTAYVLNTYSRIHGTQPHE